MTRNLKVLGLALAAVLAMSAFIGSSASAAEFHSEGENTTVTGSQVNTHLLKTTAGEITCLKVTSEGTMAPKTSGSITISEFFSECHIIFFGSKISATLNTNSCHFVLYASGSTDIVCPAGKKITFSASGCTVEIGAQTGKKSVSYANQENKHIHISFNVSGISYNHSGFTCGTGSGTTGTYVGTTTASGNKGKIWYE
jgi:hypothetical protein